MALLSTPLEKAQRRLADTRSELAAARARLRAGLDYEEGLTLREGIASLERKEAAAVDALTFAQRAVTEAAAVAQKATDVAKVEAFRREAEREMPRRFAKIGKLLNQLAEELTTVAAHTAQAAEANRLANQHGLELVVDGEFLARAIPRKVTPAQYQIVDVWKDGAGRQPRMFRKLPSGELVPEEAGYVKSRERVQVSPERVEGGHLPGGRLASQIKLVDLGGNALWPRP